MLLFCHDVAIRCNIALEYIHGKVRTELGTQAENQG